MIEAPHFSQAGARKPSAFALPESTFDGTVNSAAMHQAVKVFLNNQRQGTAMTKTRSFVSGGNQKPWKQKGTGRARAGSTRAPHWRGGGIVFGPQPRDYRTDIPRKLRQLARKSALNARAAEGAMYIVERLEFAAPKTSQLVQLLETLGVAGRKTLILTHGVNPAVYLSSRNIARVQVTSYHEAAAYDILWAEVLVVEDGAFGDEPPPAPKAFVKEPKAPRAEAPAAAPKKAAKPKAAAQPKAEKPVAEKPEAEEKAQPKKAAVKKATKAEKPSSPKRAKAAPKKPAPKKKGGK
jgi:large subunit ribosomal protein L4